MFLPILILAFFVNKGFIPSWLFSILTIIIAIIGFIMLFYTIRSNMMRDNMMYQEYHWSFDPSTAPKPEGSSSTSSTTSTDPWNKPMEQISFCK